MSEEKKEVKDEQENTARSEAMAVLEMGGPDIAAAPAEGDDKAKGKKPKRSVPAGIAFIKATFNNSRASSGVRSNISGSWRRSSSRRRPCSC